MKGTYLGEFEEVVLLAVAILAGDAYGASITNEIEQQMGRSVNLGAVHAALHRLEEKGLLSLTPGWGYGRARRTEQAVLHRHDGRYQSIGQYS